MKAVLDTHLLLWWLSADPALGPEARVLISNPESAIFVSAISLWEIWLKQSLGKLQLPDDFQQKLALESFESLPLTAAQAREVAALPWLHRDPFDRMLIAQARVEKLTLLTADEQVARYGEPVRLVRQNST